ncbi:phenylalanine--tRNA ligase subunit beta [bacterium]|nr:MAG: phenylalanine--tRNA ligase subunit beta [bacterium]
MKISHAWLQEYFKKPLPDPEKLADLITFHAFEVEGIEKTENGPVIDVSVLPNRSHDCLSYEGMAREIGVLLGQRVVPHALKKFPKGNTRKLSITVEEEKLCPRYTGMLVEGIQIGPAPARIKKHLESIGQRSINNVVDIMNFVMFETGQPLHAFDADKLASKSNSAHLVVRKAKTGEKMTTLDNKDVELNENVLVIADDENVLAIAGIKGGKRAEVTGDTKNIIIESANFSSSNIRKTSKDIGIRTDASMRFEHGITPEKTKDAISYVASLLAEFAAGPDFVAGKIKDVYPESQQVFTVEVSVSEINRILGTAFVDAKIAGFLKKLHFDFAITENKSFAVVIPSERLDLRIKEDLIEEIGRIYGYEKIIPVKPIMEGFISSVNKNTYYTDKIRTILSDLGFSEISTYSFTEKGEVEVENPIAADKKFLRTTLAGNMEKALELNTRNIPLLGLEAIKLFEIGKVFETEREYISLCLGVSVPANAKKKLGGSKDILFSVEERLSDALGVTLLGKTMSESVIVFDLESVIQKLKEPTAYTFPESGPGEMRYRKISSYPFALRDVAVFVPSGISSSEVSDLIIGVSGELLLQTKLFDVFEKTFEDGSKKTSYAFRLVFQSQEKTLSDEEVNVIMENVTIALNEKEGWKVR